MECIVEGCLKQVHAKSRCNVHYRRFQKSYGAKCSIDGCGKPHHGNGLCSMHWLRVNRYGSLDAGRPIGWGEAEKHPLYHTWGGMRRRCRNPLAKGYKNYGGRGIKICDRWDDFWCFVADMGPRPVGLTLERKNNDGDYELANCEWATHKRQARNRRNNVLTEDLAAEIKARLVRNEAKYLIARSLRVPYSAVDAVHRGLSWA